MLTEYEKECIENLSKAFVPETKNPKGTSTKIAGFFEQILGNKDFNKRLDKMLKLHNKAEEGDGLNPFVTEHKDLLTTLNKFAFKTRRMGRLYKAVSKLKGITEKLEENPLYKPGRKERLTIAEYAQVAKLTDLEDIVSKLPKAFNKSDVLRGLKTKIQEAKKAIDKVEALTQKQTNHLPGDLVMVSTKKSLTLVGARCGWMSKHIRRWVAKYIHSSVASNNQQYTHVSNKGRSEEKKRDKFSRN
jgi:hypothetical protein